MARQEGGPRRDSRSSVCNTESWLEWFGMEDRQQHFEVIYRSHRRKASSEHALVLEAAGIKFQVRKEAGQYMLIVAGSDAAQARAELDAYARENRAGSSHLVALPYHGGGWLGVYGYVAVVLLVDIFQDRDVFAFDWFIAGTANADLIRQGQWWRTVTALSLHVDASHLVANIVVGGLFGLFAGQLLGSGLAWLSILVAGAAGNAINAWIRQTQHASVGASTAVFAALGIVAAHAWTRRRHLQASTLGRWTPLVSGVILLGYLGAGGARTDVVAHVAGFACGLLLGVLYGMLGERVLLATGAQLVLGIVAVAVLALAWTLATAGT